MKSVFSFTGTMAASAGAFSRFYLAGPREFMENVRVQTHVMREPCSRWRELQTRYSLSFFLLDFLFFPVGDYPRSASCVLAATTLMHTEWTREPSRTTAVEMAKVPDRSRPTRSSGGPAVGIKRPRDLSGQHDDPSVLFLLGCAGGGSVAQGLGLCRWNHRRPRKSEGGGNVVGAAREKKGSP